MNSNDVKSFLLIGNTTYSNRGCEAITRGTVCILKNVFGEGTKVFSAYLSTADCKDKQNEYNSDIIHVPITRASKLRYPFRYLLSTLKSRKKKEIYKFIYSEELSECIEKCTAVLMVGGDNYSLDYGTPDIFFKINRIVESFKKKYVIWGASIGPFTSLPKYEKYAASELKRVPIIFVRESSSVKYLKSIGVVDNVHLVADPAYCLEKKEVNLKELNLLEVMNRGAIGINLSPILAKYFNSFDEWQKRAIEIVRELLNKIDLEIVLIPHVTNHYLGKKLDDYEFLKKIKDFLPSSRLHIIPNNLMAGEIKYIISKLRGFCGARTHSTYAAISTSVPTICIGYSLKALGISKDVYGSEEYLVNGNDLGSNALIKKMENLENDAQKIRSHLEKNNELMIKRAYNAGYLLKRYCEG